jgi:hypothetical protein
MKWKGVRSLVGKKVLQFLPEMTRWTTMLPHCVENLNYPSMV